MFEIMSKAPHEIWESVWGQLQKGKSRSFATNLEDYTLEVVELFDFPLYTKTLTVLKNFYICCITTANVALNWIK